jgi:hypothetical protein
LEDDEVLAELEALRAGGLAVGVGVSVSGTTQAATIDQALQLGLFDAVQATWNLYERPGGTRTRSGPQLSGAATVGALSSNLCAIEVAWSRDLERRLAPMEEDSGAYWARRAELAWN